MKTKAQVLTELESIFRRELQDDNLTITYDSSPDTIGGWDSIKNLLLINAFEEEYKISFPIDVIFKMRNVGDICEYICSSISNS